VCQSDGVSLANITVEDFDEEPYGGPFVFRLPDQEKGKWKLDPAQGEHVAQTIADRNFRSPPLTQSCIFLRVGGLFRVFRQPGEGARGSLGTVRAAAGGDGPPGNEGHAQPAGHRVSLRRRREAELRRPPSRRRRGRRQSPRGGSGRHAAAGGYGHTHGHTHGHTRLQKCEH